MYCIYGFCRHGMSCMFYLDNIGLNELLGFRMSGKVKG
jgi:hypothetical protein